MPSWTYRQYQSSVLHTAFRNQILFALDACTEPDLQARLLAKYKVAGGSFRFMMTKRTVEVRNLIARAIGLIVNLKDFAFLSEEWQSPTAINRLWNVHFYGETEEENHPSELGSIITIKQSLVSRFAEDMLSLSLTQSKINALTSFFPEAYNRSMQGWFWEAIFFCHLRTGTLKFTPRFSHPAISGQKIVTTVDTRRMPTIGSEGVWFKPEACNEAGVDGFYCDRSKQYLLIIQTRGLLTRFAQLIQLT
jgi:hypothetical protein